MLEKIIITLVLILSAILVFSGCAKLDRVEDRIENKVDRIEDAIESKADAIEDAIEGRPAVSAPLTDPAVPTDTVVQDEPVSVTNPAQESIDKVADILGDVLREQASTLHISDSVVDSAVSAPYGQTVFITPEEAKRIALDHAGVSASDSIFDRTERDFDNGIYHYEVEFHVGFAEYEYDIHAESGRILSFDVDR